jgi:hypothetical protein
VNCYYFKTFFGDHPKGRCRNPLFHDVFVYSGALPMFSMVKVIDA